MSSAALWPGDVIAERYRIEALLGEGGMGSVYRAVQLSVGRAVALKLLSPDQPANPELVERFGREARALACLQHPSTVRLFDFGSIAPGRPFLVMELLAGADLQAELQHNGPMRWDQALRVCVQILGALGEAHELGIIHRDIKPANVFMCVGAGWPRVKMLDFGISGCVELAGTRRLTATGAVLGSAPYMSPEQAQGHAVGPATDLYALGIVLFEMLTGRTPFDGRGFTAQLVAKVLEPAPGLLEACPGLEVPAGLCELLAQSLDRDADRRPPSARALAERMGALLERADLPPLVRQLPPRSPPLLRTEPMLVPRTIADGWVPPSAPEVAARPRRGTGHGLVAAALALPVLAALWWSREPSSDSAAPPPLLALAAPSLFVPGQLAAGARQPSEPVAPEVEAGNPSGPTPEAVAPEAVAPEAAVPEAPARRAPDAPAPGSGGADGPRVTAAAGTEPTAASKPKPTAPARSPRPPRAEPRPPQASAEPPSPGATDAPAARPEPAQGPASASSAAAPALQSPDPNTRGTVFEGPVSSARRPVLEGPAPNAAQGYPSIQTWSEPRPSAPAEPERSARYLLRAYPSVTAARGAARAGEITPDERNRIIASLRRLRQQERTRAVSEYRAGYIGRAELSVRLRDIERRFEGGSEDEQRPGIHVWP